MILYHGTSNVKISKLIYFVFELWDESDLYGQYAEENSE